MRWTEENKEMLWNTIFKTQSFHLDLDAISVEWPGDEKPTPKALKEHLGKYRKGPSGDNKITFGMSAKHGVPVGKPRRKSAAAAAGTGAGVQKVRASKGRGAAAMKGKNAKGKGKAVIKEEDQEDEHGKEDTSGSDMDEEEQEPVVKAEPDDERDGDLFRGVRAEADSQDALEMPYIKREPDMEDIF
ncbi:hypothetical protein BJY00DRAFT_308390 [Aspergillus carlsbadensis]|nr:hypothetical protein BJY00DRAFT_308390 [Aspergillus carlsbadensis]